MVERGEQDDRARDAVSRNQNVLYVLPHDVASVPQFLGPAMHRVAPESSDTQILALTPDVETAMAVAEAATRAPTGVVARVLPVTGVRRAARLLRTRAATLVAGTPHDILELIRASALKLDRVQQLIIAWADAMGDGGAGEPLEAVLSEVPKSAARTVVTSHLTPAVEALVERYAWRARRAGAAHGDEGDRPDRLDLRYVAVAPQSRVSALRRVLDDLDPDCAAIYVRSEEAASEVSAAVRALGLGGGDPSVVVTRGEPVPNASILMLYESPLSGAALRTLVTAGTPVVALATPRQLPALRALAAGGRVTPLVLSGPGARARTREDRTRDELRGALTAGIPARELLALEPLLAEYDGVELAAAALRLLEQERERHQARAAAPPDEPPATRDATVRVYMSVGTRDGATPRDVVGAIANEAKIPGDRIGRVELRDTHALIELSAGDAETVMRALTGTNIRGRRVTARLDAERPRGGGGDKRTGKDRSRRGDNPDRPRRGDSPDRPRRGDGPDRPRRGDTSSRPRRRRDE